MIAKDAQTKEIVIPEILPKKSLLTIQVEEVSSLKFYYIPPKKMKTLLGIGMLIADASLIVSGQESITEANVPDQRVRDALVKISQTTKSQFEVFPHAIAVRDDDPGMAQIKQLVADLFCSNIINFRKKKIHRASSTCAECGYGCTKCVMHNYF